MEWIDVNDGLPIGNRFNNSDEVLCFLGVGCEVGFYSHDSSSWYFTDERVNESTVTHWMPLPEPPK